MADCNTGATINPPGPQFCFKLGGSWSSKSRPVPVSLLERRANHGVEAGVWGGALVRGLGGNAPVKIMNFQ